MKLFDKKSLILLISVVSINLLCIISVSYAYFTTQIVGNDKAQDMVVKAGTMEITYYDSNEVSINSMLPGDSISKQFKIVNKGTLDTKYNIKIDMETNEFEDYNDLKYTLTKNNELPSEEKILPYEDGYIIKDEEIGKGITDTYTLTLNFKKDDTNQNDNANKKLNFKIEVDSKDDIKLYEYKEPYRDKSGANRPKLYQGMIPVYFNDGKIYIADVTQEWYNYDDNEWGNAILIDNTNPTIKEKFYNEDGTLRINNQITEDDILQMYVWIPRYKYQLFNVEFTASDPRIINIEFEKGITTTGNVSCKYINEGNGTIKENCTNAINGNWYTHPAFTFGETELSGIWVGKFEPSDKKDETGRKENEIGEITILPGKTSMTYKSVSTAFYAEQELRAEGNKYNLKHGEVDTRVMKNMEWGAVAYLTSSKYGIYSNDEQSCLIEGMAKNNCEVWINNSSQGTGTSGDYPYGGTYTGCVGDSVSAGVQWNSDGTKPAKCDENKRWNTGGVKASTTGNMYGIYDMSGGTYEYIMGLIIKQDGSEPYFGGSGFTAQNMLNEKYYDIYTYSEKNTEQERGHLGDATKETYTKIGISPGRWNNDGWDFPRAIQSWFKRGGRYNIGGLAGIYSYAVNSGVGDCYQTFRSVLSAA